MTTDQQFDVGQKLRVFGAFVDATTNQPVDPDNVFFSFAAPGAAAPTTYKFGVDAQLVKDSVGNYHVDLNANVPGPWEFRWFSTGNGQGADDDGFQVIPSPLTS
jgi:hypothetical protein